MSTAAGALLARLREPDRPGVEIFYAVVLGTALALTGRALLAKPLYGVAAIVLVALVALLVRVPRYALFTVVAGFILMEEFDLSSTEAFFAGGVETSLLGMRILGVSFMDALLLMFLVPVVLNAWFDWYRGIPARRFRSDAFFIPVIIAYILGACNGWFTKLSVGNFSWESRDIIYIAGWYYICSRTLREPKDVHRIAAIVIIAFSAKSLLFIFRAATARGLFYGYDFYRFAMGSDIPLMAAPLLVSVAAYILCRDARPWIRAGLLILIGYWSVLLISALGRSTYVLTVVALVVVLAMLRRRLTAGMAVRALGMGLAGGVMFYFTMLTDVQRELVGYLLGSAFNWVNALTVASDLSIGQRVLEIMNISETLSRAGAWLWGLGWGSSWSEIVIHHPFDKGSFPIPEQLSGVHTTAHLDFVYFMLKVGVIGTALIYYGWMRFVLATYRLTRDETTLLPKLALIGILVFLIVVIPNYVYFVKLKCLMGIAFGCIGYLLATQGVHEPKETMA